MDNDILVGISGLLSNAWYFLMNSYIPGTNIAYAVLFIALCVISLGFKFLSVAIGHSVGSLEDAQHELYHVPGYKSAVKPRISSARKNDVR